MKRSQLLQSVILLSLFFSSCEKKSEEASTPPAQDSLSSMPAPQLEFEKNGLKVYALTTSPSFENAKLSIDKNLIAVPEEGMALSETYHFKVENYKLGEATEMQEENGLAFSAKGQHIHFIVDNGPYSAHYDSVVSKSYEPGAHSMLAFLARSYHESVKGSDAYVLRHFNAGGEGDAEALPDPNEPMIFYSRPKGTYTGWETEKLLLDFYLINCELSPDGYKVRATINGTEFLLEAWYPYVIEGLPKGEINIKLELLDKKGELVDTWYNPVERKVTLAEGE